MAVVWQSSRISQYNSVWKSEREGFWGKAAYLGLHQLDLILTLFAVSLGFSELNPLMRSLLATPLQLLVIKMAIPLLIAWLVPGRLLIPAIVVLAMVVGWNIKELLLLLF